MKAAMRGVLIMSGVGAAVWAVAEVINYLADSADKASASLYDVTEAEERENKNPALDGCGTRGDSGLFRVSRRLY